ncbi:MAG: RNA polymerase sigma-70 factor [Muribaculaceae bacterium]|nr:RNA polymerase sigma-70 factor [Muribaculaceae bacterium]
MELTDEQLLDRMRAGDTGALGVLYMRYSARVREFALRFSGDEKEAEDITHNVFCHLWERRDALKGVDSLKAYLFKMTRNDIFSLFRHRKVEREYQTGCDADVHRLECDEFSRITTAELLEMVNLAIERMPELRRRIFMMSRYDNMTYAEIATTLDISAKTVQYHIGQALAELRKLINVMLLFV